MGVFSEFLVSMRSMTKEFSWRGRMGLHFLLICKKVIIYRTIFLDCKEPNFNSGWSSYFDIPKNSFSYYQRSVVLNWFQYLVEGIIKSLVKDDLTIIEMRSYGGFVDCNQRQPKCNMLKIPNKTNCFFY